MAPGARGDVEAVAGYLHEHEIACALAHPFYAVGGAAAAAPPAPPRRAVRSLGGAQRRARARAQPAGGDLHRDARRHRHRRQRRPRRRRRRAHLDGDAGGGDAWRVPRARPREAERSRAATRARRPSGRTPRWRSPCGRSATATRRAPDPRRGAADGRARDERGRRPRRRDRRRPRARRRQRAAAGLARRRRTSTRRAASCSPAAARRLLATPTSPPRAPPRAQAARGGRPPRAATVPRRSRTGPRRSELFDACVARSPTCPRSPSSGARRRGSPPRSARRRGSRWSRTDRLHPRRHAHARRDPRARRAGLRRGGRRQRSPRRPPPERGAEVAAASTHDVTVGVPSLPAVVEALADGRYDLVHVSAPGPAGVLALVARALRAPGRRRLPHRAGGLRRARIGDRRSGSAQAASAVLRALPAVLSPSAGGRRRLAALGVTAERIVRWDRGVDLARFSPALRHAGSPRRRARINVLYAGRLTREKGVDLLADAFVAARERDPRLQLVDRRRRPRGGPRCASASAAASASSAGSRATSWRRAYASADLFLFCSQTDTFGQVVLEAQASGLPSRSRSTPAARGADRRRCTTWSRRRLPEAPDPRLARDLGVDRVTLLVDPATRLRLFFQSRWSSRNGCASAATLVTRSRTGSPTRAGRPPSSRRWRACRRARSSPTGASCSGCRPRVRGFVAPMYATTPAPRQERRRATTGGRRRCVRSLIGVGPGVARDRLRPRSRTAGSPHAVPRCAAALAPGCCGLDLHPADFDRPSYVLSIEAAPAAPAVPFGRRPYA